MLVLALCSDNVNTPFVGLGKPPVPLKGKPLVDVTIDAPDNENALYPVESNVLPVPIFTNQVGTVLPLVVTLENINVMRFTQLGMLVKSALVPLTVAMGVSELITPP